MVLHVEDERKDQRPVRKHVCETLLNTVDPSKEYVHLLEFELYYSRCDFGNDFRRVMGTADAYGAV